MLLTGLLLKTYLIVGLSWAYVDIAYHNLIEIAKRKNAKDAPTPVSKQSLSEA